MGAEEPKAQRSETSMQLSTPGQQRVDRLAWIIDQLSLAAVAKGQVFPPERLRINAEDLIDIPQDALAAAFARARRELDYLPGVAEIRRLAMVDDASRMDAEMRSAWDLTIKFVDKYVSNDVHGEYGPEHGWYGARRDRSGNIVRPATYPQLDQRILDVVRRTGGWKQYKCMTQSDLPFQQKRFFDEYRAWAAVEKNVDSSRMLAMTPVNRLPAAKPKPVDGLTAPRPESQEHPDRPTTLKAMPESQFGNEWYAERRARLKKQAAELLAKRKS